MNIICPNCKKEIDDSAKFCPLCGQELSLAGTTTLSSSKKIKIYLASFFLSPLGLFWFFKYFKSDETENRYVAYTCLIITLLPLITTAVIGSKYIGALSSSMELYNTNLDAYSKLGL